MVRCSNTGADAHRPADATADATRGYRLMTSRSDLIAEAVAGACAAVATAVVLDRSPVKEAAAEMPRLGWKPDDEENPPILARLLLGALATIVFRSVFSVTRAAAKQVV
jgi:hypothetical protein